MADQSNDLRFRGARSEQQEHLETWEENSKQAAQLGTCTCPKFAIHRDCPDHGWMFEERKAHMEEALSKNPLQPTPTAAQPPDTQHIEERVCLAHGPYRAHPSENCPQWPKCITDLRKPEFLAMAAQSSAGLEAEARSDFEQKVVAYAKEWPIMWTETAAFRPDLPSHEGRGYLDLRTQGAWLWYQRGAAFAREHSRPAADWNSPFNFPDKDGEYLVFAEGYTIGRFIRQTEHVGHWFPSFGLKGWLPLPAAPLAVVAPKEAWNDRTE